MRRKNKGRREKAEGAPLFFPEPILGPRPPVCSRKNREPKQTEFRDQVQMGDNGLLNIEAVEYDVISAIQGNIQQISTLEITPLSGTNIAVNANLIVSPTSAVTGNTLGIHTGDVIGNVVGNVVGNMVGNVTGNLTGNVSGTSTGFTGSLVGDVVGTQTTTQISSGVIRDANINAAAAIADTKLAVISSAGKVSNSATTATTSNTPSAIVLRDGTGAITGSFIGNLAGNATTATTAGSYSGTLSGDVTGTTSATVIAAGVITNAKVSATASIVDTKLATISTAGKVDNSATTATALSTAGAIASRDTFGNCGFRTVTADSGYIALRVIGAPPPATPTLRWAQGLLGAESGSDSGSDFSLLRFNDAGTSIGAALSINRATGAFDVPGKLTGTDVYAATIRGPAPATLVEFPQGLSMGLSQPIRGAGIVEAHQLTLYNSGTGDGSITGAGNINFINSGGINFYHRNATVLKSLAIDAGAWGADPFSPMPLAIRSGATGNNISASIGRTGNELEFAVAAAGGQYANDAVTADAVIRCMNTSNSIKIALGTTTVIDAAAALVTIKTDSAVSGNASIAGTATIGGAASVASLTSQGNVVAAGYHSDNGVKHDSITASAAGTFTVGTGIGWSGYGRLNLLTYYLSGSTWLAQYAGNVGFCWANNTNLGVCQINAGACSQNVTIGTITNAMPMASMNFTIASWGATVQIQVDIGSSGPSARTIKVVMPFITRAKMKVVYDVEGVVP